MTLEDKLSEELNELKRVRDEIRVKIHLGKAEARELWERSEQKLEEGVMTTLHFALSGSRRRSLASASASRSRRDSCCRTDLPSAVSR